MIIYCHNAKVLVILTSTFFIFSRSSTFKQLSSSVHNQLTFRGGVADLHRRYIKISNRHQSLRACKHSFLSIFSIFRLVEGVFQYRPVSSVKISALTRCHCQAQKTQLGLRDSVFRVSLHVRPIRPTELLSTTGSFSEGVQARLE